MVTDIDVTDRGEYKVGDRVILSTPIFPNVEGSRGRVIRVEPGGNFPVVVWLDGWSGSPRVDSLTGVMWGGLPVYAGELKKVAP